MISINPMWGVALNFLMGLGGLAESTGLTNVLTTSGGKAGAVAATVIAAVNFALHGVSSAAPGPMASEQPVPNPRMPTSGR